MTTDEPLAKKEADDLPDLIRESIGDVNYQYNMGDIEEILEKVYQERGFDFRQYKKTSLERRLQKRLRAVNLKSYQAYIVRLSEDPAEYDKLMEALLINVTEFFRDRDAFDVIRDKVLPDIMEYKMDERFRACFESRIGPTIGHLGRIQGGEAGESPQWALTAESTPDSAQVASAQGVAAASCPLRALALAAPATGPILLSKHALKLKIWSAGCASGEEAYSMAILLNEILENRTDKFEFTIYGTDIDKDSLEKAKAAAYRIETVNGKIADEILNKYFAKNGGLRVKDSVKKNCRFIFHDLVLDKPFIEVDLIVCRNVAIYFERPLQEKIYMNFCQALNEKGHLFLGKAETLIGPAQDRFTAIDKHWKIYMKNIG